MAIPAGYLSGSDPPASLPGILVGLEAEARIARRLGWPVAVGGGTAEGARDAARRLLDQGCAGIVSFGLAGGLDAGLRPGDVVVPRGVLAGAERYDADAALSRRLGGFTHELLYGGDRVLATATDKVALAKGTGACAVDLESGPAAEEATRRGAPFAILRAVCDPAERTLPPAAALALDAGGRIGLLRVALSVLRCPGQVPGLVRLAGDAARARSALVRQLVVVGRGAAARE